MSILNLQGNHWDTESVYDTALGKTQAEINAEGGTAGEDGFSPTVAVSAITGGHRVTITDAEGDHPFDVMDGTDGATGPKGDTGDPAPTAAVTGAVEDWLEENITQETGYVIDASLSTAGAAADAKAVGDEVGNLKTAITQLATVQSLPTSYWWSRSIASSYGGLSPSTTRISTNTYIKGILKVSAQSGYKYVIAAYQSAITESYIGMWNGTTFAKAATWFTGETLFPTNNYYYKIGFAKSDDSTIDVDVSSNFTFYTASDITLSQYGTAADAGIVGEKAFLTRRQLTSTDDLNNITESGVYSYAGASMPSNAPDFAYGGIVIVYQIESNAVQEYFGPGLGTDTVYAKRYKTTSSWCDWDYSYSSVIGKATLSSNSDLNNITQTGYYYFSGNSLPANIPENAGGYLCVYKLPNINALVQVIYNANRTWHRIKSSSYATWYPWVNDTPQYNSLSAIPVLALSGDTTGMSKDDAVTMNYSLFGTTGTATVKWQGSSSTRYAKKNYTIKFDTALDGWNKWATFANSYRAANGNISTIPTTSRWGSQTKFCTKANWVDASMAKNIVCARLWGQIVKSRVTAGDITDNRKDAPNYGAVDGFPIEIKINDQSLGLYTFNIPKDKWQFAMGESSTEYIVSGEDNASLACQWKATATLDGTDYSVEYAQDGVEASTIAASLNTAISAAINAGSDWETTLASYLDIDSVFDYFIFTCCVSNTDALARNILYGTYDGTKWFMSAYDMDTTFGADPYGSMLFPVVTQRTQFAQAATIHRLAYLIYTYSKSKLKARYQELRSTILSDENVWHELANFVVDIPSRDYAINNDLWVNMPGTSAMNVSNFMEYYRMHCSYLDSEIEALS